MTCEVYLTSFNVRVMSRQELCERSMQWMSNCCTCWEVCDLGSMTQCTEYLVPTHTGIPITAVKSNTTSLCPIQTSFTIIVIELDQFNHQHTLSCQEVYFVIKLVNEDSNEATFFKYWLYEVGFCSSGIYF